jgi:hypothetical protein
MKRLILLIMILMLVLTTQVIPQSVYGADDDENLLTTDEKNFYRDFYQRVRQGSTINHYFQRFSSAEEYHKYKRAGFIFFWQKKPTDVEIWRDYKSQFDFDYGCSVNAAPSKFRDIQEEWNTNICPRFGKIRLIVERAFVPSISEEGWLAIGKKIDEECGYLEQLISNVWRKYYDRQSEIAQQRKKAGIKPQEIEKEVKEEVKKELLKDDTGKSEGDSDDLFDFDCFIATAAYGTPAAREIDELRYFRDEYLRDSYLGNEFIKFYYENSPPIAEFISEHEILRTIVREGFVDPIVKIVEFTENWWTE